MNRGGPSRRDPWLDNAKIVLVTVVVVGHALVLLPDGEVKDRVYDLVYYFHIPAFVLVTGYLSRSFRWTRRHLTSVVTTLLVPYLLFEWLMAMFRVRVTGELSGLGDLSPLWLDPHWPMWYLVVLALWRLATPLLRAHWTMVPLSTAVSLFAGGIDVEYLDLNRALGFLPFFVLGLHLPERVTGALRARWSPLPGVATLVGIWWLTAHTDDHWSTRWLYYRASYAELDAGFGDGAENRAALLLIGTVGAFALLTLVPRGRSFITSMGAYTMGVYLLHGFWVRYAEAWGWSEALPDRPWVAVGLTTAAAVAVSLLLAWPPVARPLLWLVDPVNSWLRRRADARRGPANDAPPSATPEPHGPGPRR